ncbi:MAG: hypothetical protein AAGJ68_13360 [Pseudomonadota bacterium]
MTCLKSSIVALGAGLSIALVANAHPVPKEPAPNIEVELADPNELKTGDHKHDHIHPKPGASLTFSHSISGTLSAGDTSFVEIKVKDGYSGGEIVLEASSVPGVEVFGPGQRVVKDMAVAGPHTWLVDFEVEADGVYYIPVLATVEPSSGMVESRAYAVRLEVGDWKTVQAAKEATKSLSTMPTGEMAMILEAEETIE